MKDKLEKNGHKKSYYVMRKTISGLCLSLIALSCAIIPVGISFKVNVSSMDKNRSANNTVSLVEGKRSVDNVQLENNSEIELETKDENKTGVKDEKSI